MVFVVVVLVAVVVVVFERWSGPVDGFGCTDAFLGFNRVVLCVFQQF